MKNSEIEKAIVEARKFIETAEKCLNARSVSYKVKDWTFHASAPKESGALRRSSMDLTRPRTTGLALLLKFVRRKINHEKFRN